MIEESQIQAILAHPGTIRLPGNLAFRETFMTRGGRVVRQPSGHLVFYGPHGRRILFTDPAGHPLHECEWGMDETGEMRMTYARIRLDWGRWVGIKPQGLVNTLTLDLSRKPGWERLKPDDLRQMAARSMNVPFEEVRFFYGDEDLQIDSHGRARIRHRKDALYILPDGSPESAQFMSCMGAMHWERIDFLPVVELFRSLLPGTGNAAFELIRELYDDQNPEDPLPLSYRGIPTYPSEDAYRLFGLYFTPVGPDGSDPYPLFMDPGRAHKVRWYPAPDPPRRYIDAVHSICVTVKAGAVQKVTAADDPAGVPFVAGGGKRTTPCNRRVLVTDASLLLKDGDSAREIPIDPSWGVTTQSPADEAGTFPFDWRALFNESVPQVAPAEAFATVLLFPEEAVAIGEEATQGLVGDHLQDLFEEDPEVVTSMKRASRILVDNLDPVCSACLVLDRPRTYRVLYERPPFAQKQAQLLWNRLAQRGQLEQARDVLFFPGETFRGPLYQEPFDLICRWIPFEHFEDPDGLRRSCQALAGALHPGGLACVVGPESLEHMARSQGLHVIRQERVADLPSVRMHRTILPHGYVRPDLVLFLLRLS